MSKPVKLSDASKSIILAMLAQNNAAEKRSLDTIAVYANDLAREREKLDRIRKAISDLRVDLRTHGVTDIEAALVLGKARGEHCW